ncbi:MAG: CbtA family protein [Stellaceae bacterium]
MTALRRTLLAGLLAGLIAGGFATGLQALRVTPLILAAEVYESAAPATHEHDAGAAAWEPAEGLARSGFTLLANIVVGCGFGFLLAGAFAWRETVSGEGVGARAGLLWGLAGFATFSLAPSLGLPPAPPSSAEADLAARETWWLLTVIATGLGLYLAVYARSWVVRIASLPIIALPHIWGAPVPTGGGSSVPAELATQFALASILTAGAFWALLGTVNGWLYRRLGAKRAEA